MPALFLDNGQVNHAYLKLDLYCKGLKIDPSCTVGDDGRRIIRNRAGLGSGLELIVGHDMATNTPVVEQWVNDTPYLLMKEGGDYVVWRRCDGSPAQPGQHNAIDYERVDTVQIPEEPRWYSMRTSSGKLMSRIGCLQGTYLGIYWGPRCNNWSPEGKPEFCKFCTEGQNLGREEDVEKSIEDVVETAIAARRESGITFVHFNCGFVDGNKYWELLEPVMRAVKERTGLLIGMQAPPDADFDNYWRAKELGVNNMSFCFEVLDPDAYVDVGPGKARRAPLQRYLDAIDFCANTVRFDTVNGEIIAGLESPESSMRAIDWITEHGAIPTVCVHRPLFGAAYQDLAPPKVEEMAPIFGHMYDRCMQHGLPIGIAPNVHVSLILMPDECRYLSELPDQKPLTRFKLWAMHKVFSKMVDRMIKIRHQGRSAHPEPTEQPVHGTLPVPRKDRRKKAVEVGAA